MWWRVGLIAVLVSVSSGMFLSACTMPRSLATLLFEDVPPPGQEKPPAPVIGRLRHPPLKPPPEPLPVVVVPQKPPKPDWHALYAKLPRDAQGAVNWVRALNDKLISPRPGIAPNAEDQEPVDMDVELVPQGMADFKVVFPHKVHTQWLACANCHAGLFEMEKGKTAMSMEKINEGGYCGVCHGKVAAPDLSGCPRCHTAMPVAEPAGPPTPDWKALYAKLPRDEQGAVKWVRALDEKLIAPKPGLAPDAEDQAPLDLDLEFVPKGMPDFKVVFPHRAHTQWLACANCHTGIFEMEKGKAAMTMEKLNEGAYCGACHGKVAAPELTGCPRCHTTMPK